jgi:hypothetical protein
VSGQEPLDYRCPECGREARLVIGPTQAVCGTDGCEVLTFNPSLPDGGRSDAGYVDWSDEERE